jgi:hypothetical protein
LSIENVGYLEKLVKNPVLVAKFDSAPLGMVGNVAGIGIGSKKQAQKLFQRCFVSVTGNTKSAGGRRNLP